MASPEEANASANEKLVNKEQVTASDLKTLSASLHAMPAQQLSALKANLDTYRAAKQTDLAANPDTNNAFHALQVSVQEEEIKKKAAAPTETLMEEQKNELKKVDTLGDIGDKISANADVAWKNTKEYATATAVVGEALLDKGVAATTTAYGRMEGVVDRQIDFWKDPNKTTGQMVMRVVGYTLGAVGILKLAQMVAGRPEGSRLWKIFKFLGVSAGAVWLINKFVKKSDAETAAEQAAAAAPSAATTQTQAPTNAAPTQTQTTRTAPIAAQGPANGTPSQNKVLAADPNAAAGAPAEAPVGPLMKQLKDGEPLVGAPAKDITIGANTYKVAFTNNRISINGNDYKMTSDGNELNIYKAMRSGNAFTLEAGLTLNLPFVAPVEMKESTQLQESELEEAVLGLTRNQRFETETKSKKKVIFTKA